MPTLKEQICSKVETSPGLTDRQLTNELLGTQYGQQAVNQAARILETAGQIRRARRPDGRIGNYPGALQSPRNEIREQVDHDDSIIDGLSDLTGQ